MARKKVKLSGMTDVEQEIHDNITRGVSDLFKDHADKLTEMLAESDGNKVTVRFSAKIDTSQSAPIVVVRLSFSNATRDSRTYTSEDPKQPTLPMEQDTTGGED